MIHTLKSAVEMAAFAALQVLTLIAAGLMIALLFAQALLFSLLDGVEEQRRLRARTVRQLKTRGNE